MAQYRDLNAPPQQTFAEIVSAIQDQAKSSKTGASGVKDLGDGGDIIWPRWDGGEESVRAVGENVEAARESIAELNDVILPELSDELDAARTDLQQKLDAANARIDDIIVDGGGAGNFTTYSINEPSAAGTGEGDQWFRVVNGEVIGQWRWDGSVWQPVTLTDAIIAGIDLSKLVSNGNLSEVVANKMFADLFTANKITAQELAVGAVTAENIAAGAIHADEIVGGSFTGETFEGGTFTGGLFKTSDALPGQVQLSDDAYVDHFEGGKTLPGLRITPVDTSGTNLPAAIGPSEYGLTVFGGRNLSGGSSIVQCHPDAAFLRSFRPNGSVGGEMQTSPEVSLMQTRREDNSVGGVIKTSPEASLIRTFGKDGVSRGTFETAPTYTQMVTTAANNTSRGIIHANTSSAHLRVTNANNAMVGRIHVDANESYLFSAAGGSSRYLTVDATGVWVKTNKSGSWEWWNLEETANDTGWINFTLRSGISGTGSPALRLKGGMVYFRGTLTRSGSWAQGWTEIAGPFNERYRPETTMQFPGAITDDRRTLLRMGADGILSIYMSASIAGTATVPLNPLSYVLG